MEHLALALWLGAMPLSVAAERLSIPGHDGALAAWYEKPAGGGPHPAVVMLHGCSGARSSTGAPAARHVMWSEALRVQGFATLLVDSFGSRGEREICTQNARRISPGRQRREDARAALRWLASQPGIDAGRIHLLGWSNGAMAVLHAVAKAAASSPRYRSAIAFYPGCAQLARTPYQPEIPLLILSGGADDWTPAVHCEALAKVAAAYGAAVEIEVYEGAHHGFDAPFGSIRWRPEVRNPSMPGGRGATVGPHPEARAKVMARALAYLSVPNAVFHVEPVGPEAPFP